LLQTFARCELGIPVVKARSALQNLRGVNIENLKRFTLPQYLKLNIDGCRNILQIVTAAASPTFPLNVLGRGSRTILPYFISFSYQIKQIQSKYLYVT
jgi:hypothetical protein